MPSPSRGEGAYTDAAILERQAAQVAQQIIIGEGFIFVVHHPSPTIVCGQVRAALSLKERGRNNRQGARAITAVATAGNRISTNVIGSLN
jgi:hypothetical protein